MGNFNFEGETNLLSEKQIKFVSEVLEKHGFNGSKVIIAPLGKVGDNYGSTVKTITAEREDGKTLIMVAKIAPTIEHIRATMNTLIMFQNESLMYTKVLPKFCQLDIEAGIPEEDRFKFPICYGALEEELHEIILLEDLRQSDYIMQDRLKSLTNKEIGVILNSFAKLHSFSFVLKNKDKSGYEELASKLTNFFTSTHLQENAKENFSLMEDHIITLFDEDEYKNKIRGCLTDIGTEARKLKRCDATSKYSVILHGDSWVNNILFKMNNDGIPDECMLIDYQLSAESSPVSDFLYIIFSCTDYDTRTKYYDSWIDEYHDKLDKYLSLHGLKANFVYSKEKMLADLKRYSKFFLGWSMMISNVLCMDLEEAARFKDALDSTSQASEIMESMNTKTGHNKTQILLKSRVQGIIDSYYDLGYHS